MTVDVLKGTERDAIDLGRLLGEWRQGTFRRTASQVVDEPRRGRSFRWGYALLLRPLVIGTPVLGWEMEYDESSYILDVAMYGTQQGFQNPPEFILLVDGVGRTIRPDMTAEEFAAASGVTGQVSLGATEIELDGELRKVSPVRWRISWPDREAAELLTVGTSATPGNGETWVRVERSNTVGTGSLIECHQIYPAGWETPLRTGALVGGPVANGVLQVNAAEGRYWFPGSSDSSSYY